MLPNVMRYYKYSASDKLLTSVILVSLCFIEVM